MLHRNLRGKKGVGIFAFLSLTTQADIPALDPYFPPWVATDTHSEWIFLASISSPAARSRAHDRQSLVASANIWPIVEASSNGRMLHCIICHRCRSRTAWMVDFCLAVWTRRSSRGTK